MEFDARVGADGVALETTLLAHGVPRGDAAPLARRLAELVRAQGATPAVCGVLEGRAIVGMTESELAALLDGREVRKLNTANLGAALAQGWSGATTVSATMELAARAGVRVFATGGVGGAHEGYGARWDVSADLAALARFPVAVVSSGVKSILDVASTREALETLGAPVIGHQTDSLPRFYLRESDLPVDARFDAVAELGAFIRAELARTQRGVLVVNPIPKDAELDEREWGGWLAEAQRRAESEGASGRDVTPRTLELVHELSGGATVRANVALVESNAELAGNIAAAMVAAGD